jgi:thymidylate kinase
VLLVAESEITVDDHRLTGQAAVADLLIRPLLRGRVPEVGRLAQARTAWSRIPEAGRASISSRWRGELGGLALEVVAVLDGVTPRPDLPIRARRLLLRRTLSRSGLGPAWQQRHSIVPARRKGPLGQRARGVVVATVGTDGSGKSTVAGELSQRLANIGFTSRAAYFGMARGNLPGVGLARRLLGVPAAGGEDVSKAEVSDAPLDHAGIRRIAAWYYALEYGWRYLTTVAGPRRRGEVVICDRYVYDLRDSPWPGSRASAFAERLVPRPDIMVLPDAPAEVIHARKPERSLADQRRQQEQFRGLLAERPGRCANLIVDTSGQQSDPVEPLVLAVLSAAHLGRV